jgi:hypothetical protein
MIMVSRFTSIAVATPNRAINAERPTIMIRQAKLDGAREILNKLADRAEAFGQSITWREESYTREVSRIRWDGKRAKVIEQWVDIYVTGGAPKIGDHSFIAMLERQPGGVIVKAVPDIEIGAFGAEWDGRCDHCGKNRSRVHGYVVEGSEGRKVIGQSCVRDYLGMDVPANMLSVLNRVVTLSDLEDEDEGSWGRGGSAWATDVLGVMAAARCAVGMFGYAKKDQESRSTYARVRALLSPFPSNLPEVIALKEEFYSRADHYQAEGEKIIEWGRKLDGVGDYINNLRVILSSDYVSDKNMGLAVSAVTAYDREMEKIARAALPERAAGKGFFGTVKQRAEHDVTIDRIYAQDNHWGCFKTFYFRTQEGQILIWKTDYSTSLEVAGRPANNGDKLRIAFTPTRHDVYKDEERTYVNRCKVV